MICSGGAGRYSTPSPNYSRTDVQALVYLITSRDEKKTFKQSEIEPMVSMPETFSRFNVNVTQKIMGRFRFKIKNLRLFTNIEGLQANGCG